MRHSLILLSAPAEPSGALIIVQGLDSNLYGQAKQRSDFTKALIAQFGRHAVFGFDYPQKLREFAVAKSDLLTPAVADLTQHLEQMSEDIIICGHCLGALIVTRALLELPPDPRSKITAILIDSLADYPDSEPGPWASGLLDVLKLSAAGLSEQGADWRKLTGNAPPWLAVHAILSRAESWLTQFSPDNGIPDGQMHRIDLPHEDLVQAGLTDNHPVLCKIGTLLS